MTNYRLMQVKSVAECSKGRILRYLQPSLSYHLLLRSLFCLFLSGRFTQVLLYVTHELTLICYIMQTKLLPWQPEMNFSTNGPQREKTCLQGFRQITTQTSLLSSRD